MGDSNKLKYQNQCFGRLGNNHETTIDENTPVVLLADVANSTGKISELKSKIIKK